MFLVGQYSGRASWQPEIRGHFILLPDGTLLVGNTDRFAELVAFYEEPTRTGVTPDEMDVLGKRWQGKIVVAGYYDLDHMVVNVSMWGTTGSAVRRCLSDEDMSTIREALTETVIAHPELSQ